MQETTISRMLENIDAQGDTHSPFTPRDRASNLRPPRRLAGAGDRPSATPESGHDLPSPTEEAGLGPQPPKEVDYVNHPPHYTAHPSGVECITITEWMNFNLGNAIKYMWRAGEKGAQIEDLKKARWYLDREIGRLEKLLAGKEKVV